MTRDVTAYRIIGIESSPYAVKVRAVMRYRRIPHHWVARMPQFFAETQQLKPLLMPVVQFPEGDYRTDSSPILLELERRHTQSRSILPSDPAHVWLSELIEDMADEWLSKCLFHFRFSDRRDQMSGASWVIDDAHPGVSTDALAPLVEQFVKRQVARMPMVGCVAENAPLIEAFYREVLACLEAFAASERYLFGSRPSIADFGLYGQLKTMAHDPTPMEQMRALAPRTEHWVQRLDDASGVEGSWGDAIEPAVAALTALAGRYYLPYLRANHDAIAAGEQTLSMLIDGQQYRQPCFRYQAKCYDYLRYRFQHLDHDARTKLEPLLEQTRCLAYLD